MLNLYICYVIVFKKKKEQGDFIKKICWQLYNNDELIVNNENAKCEYQDSVIKYEEDDGLNTIDLNKKSYIRENKEYRMEIDFANNTFNFLLKEKKRELSNKLLSSELIIKDDIITLKYALDNEEKKIIIQMLQYI